MDTYCQSLEPEKHLGHASQALQKPADISPSLQYIETLRDC